MDVNHLETIGCVRTESSAWLDRLLEKEALTAGELQAARTQVNTTPTPAQQAAGNYAKGHVTWQGLEIAIENPRGSTRSGVNKDGKKWSSLMHADYGYFKGVRGKDKDHLDVFIGPQLDSEYVVVINQVDPATGKFDEHKVVVGCNNEQAARELYLKNYEDGWQGLGSSKPLTLEKFVDWLWKGDLTKQAVQRPPKMGGAFRLIDPQAPFSEELQQKGEQIYSLVKAKQKLQQKGRKRRSKRAADWGARLARLQARRDPLGLESKSGFGDLSQLQPEQVLDFVIQHHLRSRAGRHYDVRFGNPDLGLYSWATRKELPLPGGKILLNQTPLHSHAYGDYESQAVRQKQKGQIRVNRVAPGKLHFSTEEEQPQQFLMLQPPSFKERQWLLINRTPPDQFKAAGDWLKEAKDTDYQPTVAVDLDGTLAENLPEHDPHKIGPPRRGSRKWLKRFRQAGARIIIFTVRGNKKLVQTWLDEHQMPYDYINENPDQPADASGKVIADVYYDDRAVNANRPHSEGGPEVLERLKSAGDDSLLTYTDPGSILEFLFFVKDAG